MDVAVLQFFCEVSVPVWLFLWFYFFIVMFHQSFLTSASITRSSVSKRCIFFENWFCTWAKKYVTRTPLWMKGKVATEAPLQSNFPKDLFITRKSNLLRIVVVLCVEPIIENLQSIGADVLSAANSRRYILAIDSFFLRRSLQATISYFAIIL